jgi:hypothetical protein
MPEEVILASEFGECRLQGLRPQGAFGIFDMVREDTSRLDKA